jgi:hypothetical protein
MITKHTPHPVVVRATHGRVLFPLICVLRRLLLRADCFHCVSVQIISFCSYYSKLFNYMCFYF